jgi:pilus assembly protein CpaC
MKMRAHNWLIYACLSLVVTAGGVCQSAPAPQASAPAATTASPALEQIARNAAQQSASATAQQPASQEAPVAAPATPASQQPSAPEATASAPLRVMVDKSLLVNTQDRLRRVSVTDPAIADALVVTPTQVLVHGRAPGEVSLLLWDEYERSRSFDLRVDVDVTAAADEIHRIFPEEKINVEASRSAIVLSGHVSTKEDAERAGAIAAAFSKNIVNVLTFGPVGAQEVLLEVKFAEVDRTALTQIGVNILSTGAANTIGTTTTGQFGGFGSQQINDVFGPGTPPHSFQTQDTINDVLNLFLFRPDIHLGAVVRALEGKNLLQILAEPNLIAVNGKEASFLAGGEFPFPVVTPGTGNTNTVSIQFKEFGVRLKFTPVIMPSGNIHLVVAPEVSTLDFANGLQTNGFTVPALSTRRAQTEFEIRDGQSFVIAGLLDNRVTNIANKIPGLGDVPVLGSLFKSKSAQKTQSELMVFVTAHRIQPSAIPPAPMNFPEKFMKGVGSEAKQTPGGGAK